MTIDRYARELVEIPDRYSRVDLGDIIAEVVEHIHVGLEHAKEVKVDRSLPAREREQHQGQADAYRVLIAQLRQLGIFLKTEGRVNRGGPLP